MSRMSLKNDPFASIIDEYKSIKDVENKAKKQAGELNNQLKDEMLKRGVDSMDGIEYKVTLTVKPHEEFNEDKAIEILKEKLSPADFKKVVKKKEYIDDDALEKLVYNQKFDMSELDSCVTQLPPTYTLRTAKLK